MSGEVLVDLLSSIKGSPSSYNHFLISSKWVHNKVSVYLKMTNRLNLSYCKTMWCCVKCWKGKAGRQTCAGSKRNRNPGSTGKRSTFFLHHLPARRLRQKWLLSASARTWSIAWLKWMCSEKLQVLHHQHQMVWSHILKTKLFVIACKHLSGLTNTSRWQG